MELMLDPKNAGLFHMGHMRGPTYATRNYWAIKSEDHDTWLDEYVSLVSVPPVQGNDWRNHLPPDARSRIVNKILETLTRHLPPLHVGDEGLLELRSIGTRFESKIYDSATSQIDYLRRISLKMLTMESQYSRSNASGFAFNTPPYDEY